ncbi:thiol-disulfide isomerase/thioredoxin [Chitinophaga niastensis]|uniref:Thiol-disulfide isomerase/thioredoxin n=1 Tax=Chitinophaga niastensis TaxID=536980 RepID=A0A2P8HSL2_CHINA|nr:TlpA family protein disulfide reductase [Chitinophaga niastensis]PSL49185.1 thiol-disulfide isomerase/thioredoxin [Chitinophaga niastensis]
MRKLFVLLIAIFLVHLQLQAQGYQISIKLKNFTGGKLFLANYMGRTTYLADSADVSATGEVVLKGKERLLPGIYLVVLPGKQQYIEALIDKQQVFSVSIDTSDLINKTVYKNSPDNELFLSYNQFLFQQETLSRNIQQQLKAAHTAADSAKALPLQQELGKKIQDFRNGFIAKHPATILAAIFRAMKEPEIPKQPVGEDSSFAYRYFKAHYWDEVDLESDRLVRTPILEGKLKKYFEQLVPNHPDSIIVDCDAMIARTRKSKEVFKFVLWWLTYNYESSPYMGMDAVFVHLVEKYYVAGEAFWLSDEQLNKIVDRAYTMAPNLIGKQAAPLEFKDTASRPLSLYKTQAKYTVLVFWDPTCGHCKTEIPRLDSAYKASWKSKGVAMIGVKTEGTQQEWLAFINEHHLSGWVHGSDPQSAGNNYRRLYDVYSTPMIYLLDEKKKIVAKRLGVDQLQEFLERLTTKNTAARL